MIRMYLGHEMGHGVIQNLLRRLRAICAQLAIFGHMVSTCISLRLGALNGNGLNSSTTLHMLRVLSDVLLLMAMSHLDPDTSMSPGTLDAAFLRTGGALAAVDAIMNEEINQAFCAVRPPGHHAEADRAMGFCFFNTVAIAARYLQQHHGIQRVLIVDWDVHHGNGTQHAFYDDESVLFFSYASIPVLSRNRRSDGDR